ncbi:hypothetical protein LDG_8219 [Legionella drancourtii LLAP12]|uniref:Uncharacterized protein n=1 Tax=Legionella drancourtii LLAP12 TaxID=658187 RepID=G9ESE5_9GAMM|nr:hypothetical protein LDG_8219 [Legionella drancourtii LLAP12]
MWRSNSLNTKEQTTSKTFYFHCLQQIDVKKNDTIFTRLNYKN